MIENYLSQFIGAQAGITSNLTTYGGQPAYFERIAPPDTDPGWAKDSNKNPVQYPRLVYVLDRDVSNALILTGTLHVQLWALDTLADDLEALQQAVQAALNGAALNTNEGLVSFVLTSGMAFKSVASPRVIGVDLAFYFQNFVAQTTYPPDPIATLNRFCGQYLDSHLQIAPAAWAPATDAAPALYWRVVSRQTQDTDKFHWGYWEHDRLEGHVLAPDAYSRSNWVRLVAGSLKSHPYRRIRMDDGSSMRVNTLTEDLSGNPYRQGQIRLDVVFGVLTGEDHTAFDNPPLNPIVAPGISGETGGGMSGTGGPTPPPPFGPYTPPGFIIPSQPLYVSTIDTGVPLAHDWWRLLIPQDGTETGASEVTPPGPIVAPAN